MNRGRSADRNAPGDALRFRIPFPDCYSAADLHVPKVADDFDGAELAYLNRSLPGNLRVEVNSAGIDPATAQRGPRTVPTPPPPMPSPASNPRT